MKVLGIETSCDETAVAIVTSEKQVLFDNVLSQNHTRYGGVFPEMAARDHVQNLSVIVKAALQTQEGYLNQIDAIAVTAGPGLIGGLVVGISLAKALASAANKQIIAINHLEAHALVVRLIETLEFPFLLLLISGGHCQLVIAKDVGSYEALGGTLDDAVGEAFDKVAKMLEMGFPGGALIEKQALRGNRDRFKLPKPITKYNNCDFSFSGLKTAVRNLIFSYPTLSEHDIADICASFEKCVAEILIEKLKNALNIYKAKYPEILYKLVVAGGVASNLYIRAHIQQLAEKEQTIVYFPPPALCTDNGVMVAWAGIEKLQKNQVSDLRFPPYPRWKLGVDYGI